MPPHDLHVLCDEITALVTCGSDYRLARDIFCHIVIRITGDYSTEERYVGPGLIEPYRVDPAELDPGVFLTANDNRMEFILRDVVDRKKRRLTKDLLDPRLLEKSIRPRVASR